MFSLDSRDERPALLGDPWWWIRAGSPCHGDKVIPPAVLPCTAGWKAQVPDDFTGRQVALFLCQSASGHPGWAVGKQSFVHEEGSGVILRNKNTTAIVWKIMYQSMLPWHTAGKKKVFLFSFCHDLSERSVLLCPFKSPWYHVKGLCASTLDCLGKIICLDKERTEHLKYNVKIDFSVCRLHYYLELNAVFKQKNIHPETEEGVGQHKCLSAGPCQAVSERGESLSDMHPCSPLPPTS